MAVINTETIQGYKDMTPEQKVAALEGYSLPDPDYSGYVPKSTFDKTASELAALKRTSKEQLSDEQRKAQEIAEQIETQKKEIEELRRQNRLTDFKAKLLSQGYDDALASDTAAAMVDGNTEKVFANQQAFLVNYKKKVEADALKGTPKPPAGDGAATGNIDYRKKMEEAQASGNIAEAAYYARLQAMAEAEQNKT